MSRSSVKKGVEHEAQQQLFFDSKRDINPYWKSSLFSDVYLKNDIPREYKHLWENDEIGDFYNFYQGFIDLCHATENLSFNKLREADTVKDWIVPLMTLLGWENNAERHQNSYMDNESFTVIENGRKQTYRPDLIYFDKPSHKAYTQKEKDVERKLLEVKNRKTGAKIIVEAKYWDRLSQQKDSGQKDSSTGDSASALGAELQTLKYMEIFDHDFGILTDGKTWKLFHKELSQGLDRRSYDFDIGNLRELALDIDAYGHEEQYRFYAKYFFYFFSKKSLIKTDESKTVPFVSEVFEYSKKYSHSIEDDLKKRFIVTMGITCNALMESSGTSDEKIILDLDMIRNVSESHLFNVLFVKSCEVRRILPIKSTKYVRKSLHEVIETMDAMNFDPDKDWDDYLRDFRYTFGDRFDWDGFEIFNRMIDLYEIVHDGTANSKDFGFEISGFKESIFSTDEWRFAKKYKIKNRKMVEILFNLNFIESTFKGRRYQQIPYSYFTARQLGSIYESFLEFKIEKATTDMIFTGGQWREANIQSKTVRNLKITDEHIVRKGELFFSPNNKERKLTGSYYTPDYIVKYIVRDALGPLVEGLTSDQILNLKLIDPAMGSGHFLVGAIDYLVDVYRQKWCQEHNDDLMEDISETSRLILDRCVYGSDINPRAVKLAKMSLWLSTAFPGKKLEKLDDQIVTADGLLLDVKKEFKKFEKFDAVLMNPPYVSELRGNKDLFQKYSNHKITNKYYEAKMDLFYFFIVRGLDYLRDGGYLGLICEQYWLSRTNTIKLHSKIHDEACIYKHVNFKSNIIFDSAPGVHASILVMKKGDEFDSSAIQEVTFDTKFSGHKEIEEYLYSADSKKSSIVFDKKLGRFIDASTQTDVDEYYYIESNFIQQGLVTPQDSVTKKHIEQEPSMKGKLGAGIFIINAKELKSLGLSAQEKSFIKPFYEAKELSRVVGTLAPDKYVIYFGSAENKMILSGKLKVPQLKKHFDSFKKLITSSNAPYGLHRARQMEWFEGSSRVLSVRKTKLPFFTFVQDEAYVNQSVNIINTGNDILNKIYTILLNSKRTHDVLSKVKTQGDQLQVDKESIMRVPLPLWANPAQFNEREFLKSYKEFWTKIDHIFKKAPSLKPDELQDLINSLTEELWSIKYISEKRAA